MNKQIADNLEGKHGSYILPFLWLHGEPKERLLEEILAIKRSDIREFCAESRPYQEFCKDAWWDDFGWILETARSLDMRVWLLDDRRFPTGYANGHLEAPERAHLRKVQIRERQCDVLGPMKNAKLFAGGWLKRDTEQILQVIAYRHCDAEEGLDFSTAVELTDTLRDGMVYWDIPEGAWRVCVTIRTDANRKPEDRKAYYIDMLNPDSCHAMIEAVYQPHYDHFKEYFGNTFAGFFSDEPGFLNISGTYSDSLGTMYDIYPWRADLPELIAESAGLTPEQVRLAIPALWEELGEITAAIRTHYMDVVTRLFRENFSFRLGNWCRDHGVLYIGHIIEDSGCHMHLSHGPGHYFRGLDGQDMAGIDLVIHQDIPGMADCIHRADLLDQGVTEPAFFRYTMPKLASSHAHIQPLKQGRAMCEIFGAFGWAEGVPFMKGLTDIMLVSGINHFVPHAFSPKEEDPDAPPHFYNGGKNVQFPLFKNLMEYMGRCCHALSGGLHRADVAVFYNAEGHWAGGKNQLFRHVCRELAQKLMDFDIIPYDVLENASVRENRLWVNGESYGALILSESQFLPEKLLGCLKRLAGAGLPVIFTEALPERSVEGRQDFDFSAYFEAIPTAQLAQTLRNRGLNHIGGTGRGLKHLRFYHMVRDGQSIYAFSNEDIHGDVDAVLQLPDRGECLIYEPWDNRCYRGDAGDGAFRLQLEKGNLLMVVFGGEIPADIPAFRTEAARKRLELRFDILVKDEGEPDFRLLASDSELFDISAPDRLPHFSGEVLYKTRFTPEDGFTVLDLGEVGETAEVWLNGRLLGARVNAPYKFSLAPALQPGENQLQILVRSNMAHRRRHDRCSQYLQIPPTGIQGEISLCRYGDTC